MSLTTLFLVFVKFGFLCVGGGYMLVPFLLSDLVEARRVLTPEQFANLFSIAQVTPGPIGINAATYVGYLQHGVGGAILASIGLILPALGMTTLAVYTLKRYENSVGIQGFLAGVRPATLGLIGGALLIFAEMSVIEGHLPLDFPYRWLLAHGTGLSAELPPFRIDWGALAIFAITLYIQLRHKVTLTWLILGSAAAGALLCR